MTTSAPFRLSAVGDISFEGFEADTPAFECMESVASRLLQVDLVVGNLECVLTSAGHDGIGGKCTLRGDPGWAQVLKKAGIGLVSLANNHVMDFGADGLFSTIEALQRVEVNFVGAGRNLKEACAPVYLDIAQRRIAFLARSSVVVSAPTYATNNGPGVAFLDIDETIAVIRACRCQADLVVLMVHWGMEEYCYPSPAQRLLAKQLTEAGVDLVLGHHPHVLQGYEHLGQSLIAYSLGNFVFREFEWTYTLPDGGISRQISLLSHDNLASIIATFEWIEKCVVPEVSTTFTRIEQDGTVVVDSEPDREAEWRDLCAGLSRRGYRIWWRWYAMRREWVLRLGGRASVSRLLANLHRIRLRHFANAFGLLRRSFRIISEKTTNPYE